MLSIIFTGIVFFLIFSLLVLIHEFGHFIMAKRAGIKVEEFGFGLPPRLWGKKKGETIYSINWIPFGGFVRMLGEDSLDPKMEKKKRSFAAQPMRARVKVIVAGVVMNFLLAWFLLFIGFSVGMEPLLGPDDVLTAVNEEQVVLNEGVVINSVLEDSFADELGFEDDDAIVAIDDRKVTIEAFNEILENPDHVYDVRRGDRVLSFQPTEELLEKYDVEDGFGLALNNFAYIPRVQFFEVEPGSVAYDYGLRSGDVILEVNDVEIFSVPEYEENVRGLSEITYEVYRDGITEEVLVELEGRKVIVSRVLPGTPAEEIGLLDGDVIVSVNGNVINDSEELIQYVEEEGDQPLAYVIDRDGSRLFYEILPEEGKIGVLLSELMIYGNDQALSVYNVDLVSSVMEIKDEKYPVYIAPIVALEETWRMSKLTAIMFGDFVKSLVTSGEVPESVAGPVGIAQMTHGFVQEGFIPVLRFIAVLSLSLAVINILPFPALDGGRLLFIIIEFILGRKVNQKWESVIHMIGYVLILLLIVAVTYSDIVRIFVSK